MKNNTIIFTGILSIMIFFSCVPDQTGSVEIVNGITVYRNGNYPSDRDLKAETELLFILNQDTGDTTDVIRNITAIELDDDGNIYILDRRRASVFKYDSSGMFLDRFGERGTGPGEMTAPVEILCYSDTVYIADQRQRKLITFDRNGNFLKDFVPLRENGLPQTLISMGNGNFAGILFGRSGGRGGGAMSINYSLSILNGMFEKITELVSVQTEVDFRDFIPEDHINKFTLGNGNIFVAENSDMRYLIEVFDYSGNKISEIRKNHARVQYSDIEREHMIRALESRFRWRQIDPSRIRTKKAVKEIYFHKDGYLLVESGRRRSEEDLFNFILDVFKDGVYLNTVDLNAEGSDFYYNEDGFEKILKGDLLFVFNRDDNEIYIYRIGFYR